MNVCMDCMYFIRTADAPIGPTLATKWRWLPPKATRMWWHILKSEIRFFKRNSFLNEFFLWYLLLSSVVFKKINNFDFFSKNVFLIGRNCLPEAKLGEYLVHIIDNPPIEIKKFKGGLFEKIYFPNFQTNRCHFLNFENFDIFLGSLDKAKNSSSQKEKLTGYVYLVKNTATFWKIFWQFLWNGKVNVHGRDRTWSNLTRKVRTCSNLFE